MFGNEEGISNKGWHYCTGDDHDDLQGVLLLVDDAVGKTKERRDGTKGRSGGHQQRSIHPVFMIIFKGFGDRIDANDLGEHLGHKQHKEGKGRCRDIGKKDDPARMK
jgi:hypothetical protein